MPAPDLVRRLVGHPRLAECIAVVLVAQLVGAAGVLAGPLATAPPPPAPPVASTGEPIRTGSPARAAVTAPAVIAPVRLAAPGLWSGVVAAVPLGVGADGALEVPATETQLGWWADGPRPGDPGAAVVVGHVDLDGRPGVFAQLSRASVGSQVVVAGAAGDVPFLVTSIDRYAKADFPTELVYRPTERAELRLITCGGRFDERTGHYADNIVVTAVRA